MIRRRYGRVLHNQVSLGEDVDPNSYITNMADCMLVLMLGFHRGRGIHTVLQRRILIFGCRSPYPGVDRNADTRKGVLYLFHPLIPFCMEALRPR